MKTSTILQNAIKLKSWGVKHRRYLHQHPELALQEKETAHYCKSVLHSLGYKIQNSWGYGFTADLNIKRAKTRIAFRADMDALPINEKTMHNFKSKKPNIAHLCGHDAHMAIALTTAKLLKNNQASLKHNVRFIFQPSEEIPPGGALSMIKNGCLQSVTEIYGLHMWDNPLGKVSLCEGPLMAGIANFDIIIIGKGCHAAEPNKGLNPIEAVAYSIEQVKKIRNKLATKQDTILSITACNAGSSNNVIPSTAKISGTIRSLNKEKILKAKKLLAQIILPLKKQGYKIHINFILGYDPLINKKYGVSRVVNAAKLITPDKMIDTNISSSMVSEDFGYYLQKKPGAFFMLGYRNKKITAPLHSPHFDIDENAIPIGAAIFASLALTV